jgi:glucoamylase
MRRAVTLAVVALGTLAAPASAQAAATGTAPGAPGAPATWAPANKDGFGTSASETSKVWHTLSGGELTEVYYPDLGTPAVRDMQFVVSDGKTFAQRETDASNHSTRLIDRRSLTYRQVNWDRRHRWRITKTYVTDPLRDVLVVQVRFESLTRKPLALYVLYDPALSNDGSDDSGSSVGTSLVATDSAAASRLAAEPNFRKTSSGYLGTSDGWEDLRGDFRMDWTYGNAPHGNVVQTARTDLNGKPGRRDMTLALGFGKDAAAARLSLNTSFRQAAQEYARGWRSYLKGLKRPPKSARLYGAAYDASLMTLAAHEDKTLRGAYVASPTMPWAWGQLTIDNPSDAYHLVWARDLYQIATALRTAGDRSGADRALTYLFERQQKPDGSFPQNSLVDGTPRWTNLQLDEVALPIVLAWQLFRNDAATYRNHVKKAADFIVANGPQTPQERWENQSGWSPATIASEIAGLVCAADIARRSGDTASAAKYEATADEWQSKVESWTATTNGPYSPKPYYLRLTKDAMPDSGTTYSIGDGGPAAADQRSVVDPSFLELVRLGVKRASDPTIRNTVKVVDSKLAVPTPNGTFWHRFTFDGYGETRDGGPWDISDPETFRTIGRAWPIFAGERGEYELLAGGPARSRLAAMARSANDGLMMPEQVWDENPPSGKPGFRRGEGTFSATPLAWTHAQFVRLAWSIDAGRPVEQPRVVACRYVRTCH